MDWDDHAAGWDEGEGQRAYAAAAFASLEEVLEQTGVSLRGARVCDFGCGTGLLTERLVDPVASVHAVDTSIAMLAVLEAKIARHGWRAVRPVAALPDDGVYDLVLCSSVCAFLDDYPAMAATLASRLAPGGLFVQWDWEVDPGAEQPFGLTRDGVRSALERAGLEVLRVETAFAIEADGHAMRPLVGVGRKP